MTIERFNVTGDLDGIDFDIDPNGKYMDFSDHEKITSLLKCNILDCENMISSLNEYIEKLEKTLRDNEIGIPY